LGAGDEHRHHQNMKLEQDGGRKGVENFIITFGRQGSSSTGRTPRGGRATQTRNGILIIADLAGSTRHARHLGTITGNAGPRKQSGGRSGGTLEDRSDRGRGTIQTV
jgi:hypothetical protein